MSGLIPNSRLGKVQFYEDHLPPWLTNTEAIGLTAEAMAEFGGRVTAARAAYDAQQAAINAARAATAAFHEAVRHMHGDPGGGSDLIRTIRAHAEMTGDANVYTLAQIPPPAPPGKTPPPGTPTDLRVSLLQGGALRLAWKCKNPAGTSGTVYEVMRRVGAGGQMQYVGSVGTKSFLDETLPAGSAGVVYQITAVRSTRRGDPAQFLVSFGVGGASATVTAVTPGPAAAPARLAA